jgi:hypothetical protein
LAEGGMLSFITAQSCTQQQVCACLVSP